MFFAGTMKGSTKIKRSAPNRDEDSRVLNGDGAKFDVEGSGVKLRPATLCFARQLRAHIAAMEAELECAKAKGERAEREMQEAEKKAERRTSELEDSQRTEKQALKEKQQARALLEKQQKDNLRFRRNLDNLKSVRDLAVDATENAMRHTHRIVLELDTVKQQLGRTAEMMYQLRGERDAAERKRLDVVYEKNKLAKERKAIRSETSCLLESKDVLARETWEARRDKYKALKDRNDAMKQCREMRSELTELERKRKKILDLKSLYQDRVLSMYPEDDRSTDKNGRESSLSLVVKKSNVKLPKIYGNYVLSKPNMLTDGDVTKCCVLNNTRKASPKKDCSQKSVALPKVNNIVVENNYKARNVGDEKTVRRTI